MEGYKTLKTNDSVEFEVGAGEKGPQAANVVVTASDPSVAESPKAEDTKE